MNKQLLYAYSCVGKGWWGLLDKYIPAIQSLDPNATFLPKEKYGELRLQAFLTDSCKEKNAVWHLEREAEDASSHICEYCGEPGEPRTDRVWIKTLCDKCNVLDGDAVHNIHLAHRIEVGDMLEKALTPERQNELWEAWKAQPLQGMKRWEWLFSLDSMEQPVVIGWDAIVEDYVRSEM